jgi:hypothetical protein
LAASGGYFGSLVVGDDGVQDDPVFDGAEGHPFVALSGASDYLIKGEFGANKLDPRVSQQTIVDGAIHEPPLKLSNICKLIAYATDRAIAVWRPLL